ncbi:MAG: TlpA disulfide reductase family protein [Thermoleophilaceae bacterium]
MTRDDDRFGDLGADDRSAAERLEELDEREPEPQPEKPAPPRPSSRYSWVVGIAFLLAIIVAGLNAINTEGPGALGIEAGEDAPLFVAPLAVGGLDRDANADEDQVCDIDLPDTVNLCSLRGQAVVLTFFFTRFADCVPQLDRVEQAQGRAPGVRFVGVLVREDKDDAEELVREQGWTFPVALDRDGLVSNLYGVAGCPTTVFIDPGGDVVDTRNGEIGVRELVRELR